MTAMRIPLALTLVLAACNAHAQQDISKVNGTIEAEAGQSYGELDTVNGGIRIGEGATTGDASTVNGGIRVAARARTGSLETVNGGVRLEDDVQVDGSVETVNGEIFVARGGRIGQHVETVNGGIGLVGTQVGGSIETVQGNVTVGADSVVKGGLSVRKAIGFFNTGSKRTPRIIIGPNAVVEGPLLFEREVELYVHATARTGAVTGATAIAYEGSSAPPR